MANDGKEIEKRVGKALTNLLGKGAVMTRLHDTKSAAFFLPPSPGDFMGAVDGTPVLIECKSGEDKYTFTGCRVKDYVKPTQFAYHKMWVQAGGVSLFIFHSLITNEVEYWNGSTILSAYSYGWSADVEPNHVTDHKVKNIQAAIPKMVKDLK